MERHQGNTSTVQPVEHMRLVPAKTLVAAGVRWGQRDTGAAGVMDATIDRLRAELAIFRERVARLAPQLGEDAPHWLRAAAEAADEFEATHLSNCCCIVHEDRLATWLVPGSSTLRYCGDCAKQWATCEACGAWIDPRDAHEHACLGGAL